MIKLIDILTEIKINEPGGIRPISMDKLKEALYFALSTDCAGGPANFAGPVPGTAWSKTEQPISLGVNIL